MRKQQRHMTMATKKTAIETAKSDSAFETIAIEEKDRFPPVDNIRNRMFFVVRETLRKDLMRDALGELIRHHLPILGARIEKDETGLLVYRMPSTFSDGYKLFEWSENSIDSTLESTQLLPTSLPHDGSPTFGSLSVQDMENKWTPSDWPVERQFEKEDTPLLLAHITSYADATVVALSLPHIVSDGMGFGSLVTAWLQVMDGQTPAPFLNLKPGTLNGPDDISREELRRKKKFRVTSKAETAAALLGFLPDLVKHPQEVRRILFLPSTLVTDLRNRHNNDLKARYGKNTPALSDGDILIGILAKFAYIGRKSAKMVTLTSAVNGRGLHPALPANKPYLHNCVTFAIARLPISKKTPLLDIAHAHNQAVWEAFKVENIERDLAVTREACRLGTFPYFCEPLEMAFFTSNWSGAWHEANFAPAVARKGNDATGTLPAVVTPLVFGQARRLRNNFLMRYGSQIMCKADGGYWCDFTASTKGMELVQDLIRLDPKLHSL